MNEETALVEAERQLKEAKTAHAAKVRQETQAELRKAVSDGRKARDQYQALERDFKRADLEARLLSNDVEALNTQIAAVERPRPIDFPTEQEIAEADALRARLVAERDRAVKKLDAAVVQREQLRRRAIDAAKAYERQQWIVSNIQRKLEGKEPGWPEGGVRRV